MFSYWYSVSISWDMAITITPYRLSLGGRVLIGWEVPEIEKNMTGDSKSGVRILINLLKIHRMEKYKILMVTFLRMKKKKFVSCLFAFFLVTVIAPRLRVVHFLF